MKNSFLDSRQNLDGKAMYVLVITQKRSQPIHVIHLASFQALHEVGDLLR
jgi:hypothetical protein